MLAKGEASDRLRVYPAAGPRPQTYKPVSFRTICSVKKNKESRSQDRRARLGSHEETERLEPAEDLRSVPQDVRNQNLPAKFLSKTVCKRYQEEQTPTNDWIWISRLFVQNKVETFLLRPFIYSNKVTKNK